MKFSTVYALALATSFVAAQSLTDLPSCSTPCAIKTLPSTCKITDYECFCKNSTWLESLAPCVKTSCNEADQQSVVKMAQGLCGKYGVTINSDYLSTVTASATGSSSTGSASNFSATGSSTATATATGAARTNAAAPTEVGMVRSGLVAAVVGIAMFVL